MLAQRRRQWANIKPELVQRLAFAGEGFPGDKYMHVFTSMIYMVYARKNMTSAYIA